MWPNYSPKLPAQELPSDDIPKLVETARNLLREKYIKADIGMSGANVVAADTGTMFIIENEGNIRLSTVFAAGSYRYYRHGEAGSHSAGCL